MKAVVRNNDSDNDNNDNDNNNDNSDNTVEAGDSAERFIEMSNGWITTIFAFLVWGIVVVLDGALLALVGKGVA